MYIPEPFAFPDHATAELQDLVEAYNFGILIAPGKVLEAAHLPFVLDRSRGPLGTLIAHVARANPIWRRFTAGPEVLAVFQGPHAYVSPDWYAGRGLVPTWTYVAVHAYGVPRILDSGIAVTAALSRLTAIMESSLAPKPPWTLSELAEPRLAALKRGVVAFEIEIARLEGKRKLNQNRTAADRAGAIEALEASGAPEARAVARAMLDLD
ncbi:MAG TPA: FMN-binding negative transcriptional regulator [Geminicoccaceae bacterium]|nr:FMN-binding negative transcriptional regulator [Geminicoccaceae bacterium]